MSQDPMRNVADELTAIKAVADALEPLPDASRRHVVAYVAEALGIATSPAPVETGAPVGANPPEPALEVEAPLHDARPLDIRSLKEQKEPKSANEMAALVAYYVSELLPPDEQRAVITKADIEKYFKQANFRLPSRVTQTLPDAARAGYFDAVDRGQYKLNPVGYNLVAHGMPSRGADATPKAGRSRAVGRNVKKAARKKAAPSKAGATQRRGSSGAAPRSAKKRS